MNRLKLLTLLLAVSFLAGCAVTVGYVKDETGTRLCLPCIGR